MDTARTAPTPQQARDQLAATQVRALGSARDRRVHAANTAAMGVTFSVFATAQVMVTGAGVWALSAAFFAATLVLGWWARRAARTVPRRSRTISLAGVGTSLVLALVAVVPWLNLSAQSAPTTWPMVLVGSGVVAIPSLVAAAVIAGRRG